MILLTKLDRQKVLVLIDSIKYIESTPDTLIRFANGDMLIVNESMDQIAELVLQFKAQCLTRSNSHANAVYGVSSGETTSWT